MAIGTGGGTATTGTSSTATTSILTCGFGPVQVNQFRSGSSVVAKVMCGTTQIFPKP